MLKLLLLSALANAADTHPASWLKWVEKSKADLSKPYTSYLARDLIHLKPRTNLYVSPDGQQSWQFSATQDKDAIAEIQWNGGDKIELSDKGMMTLKKRETITLKPDKKDGAQYKLPLREIQKGIAVEFYKWDTRQEITGFLYDNNRTDLEPLREFKAFDYNPEMKVSAVWEKTAKIEDVTIAATRGEPKKMKKVATLKFTFKTQEERLTVLTTSPDNKTIMLMYRDPTNGESTYSGGRFVYVELGKKAADLKDGDKISIDFNFSFNPMCARSSAFMCPIPEDRLKTAVTAGEQKVATAHH